MSEYRNIKLDITDRIAILTFNRPDALNALNTPTVTEALDAVQTVARNPSLRVLVITGAGKAFIAGADIKEMYEKTPEGARIYSELGHQLMRTVQEMEQPTVAAINGYCLGGGLEVALSCDIRIAAEQATFGLPETILGIIPGWGATQRAARLIGTAFAKELIFTGKHITAQRAYEIGLINRIVPLEALMPVVLEMARMICHQSVRAVTAAKRVINRGIEMPLQEACRLEIDTFVELFGQPDREEGMRAFIEKREPNFTQKC